MLSRKYKTVVAGILVGVALFSPLLCGMTCLEARGEKTIVAVEAAPAGGEFVGEFLESGVVGCVLTHVVFNIDWSDLASVLEDGAWMWVGVEAARLVETIGDDGSTVKAEALLPHSKVRAREGDRLKPVLLG